MTALARALRPPLSSTKHFFSSIVAIHLSSSLKGRGQRSVHPITPQYHLLPLLLLPLPPLSLSVLGRLGAMSLSKDGSLRLARVIVRGAKPFDVCHIHFYLRSKENKEKKKKKARPGQRVRRIHYTEEREAVETKQAVAWFHSFRVTRGQGCVCGGEGAGADDH